MKVPFIDLSAQYTSIQPEIDEAIRQVIEKCAFAGGPFVDQFERAFAEFCGSRHAIGVGSGTEALWLSLVALGIGRGDEVITAPNSFIATAEAISLSGAKPVFVDIEEKTFNMDAAAVEAAISSRTKAILPVHLYGQTAEMGAIMEIAAQYGLPVVEDACQAHGAVHRGRPAGTFGAAGCFSFYPGKNLGAYGDAGAVVTDDDRLAQTIRELRDHGQTEKYHHRSIGWNARMDGVQGAVLGVKLKSLSAWNEARRRHAAYYTRRLETLPQIKTPVEAPSSKHVYHIYPLLTDRRDELIAWLGKNEIQSGIHYPVPIHLQPAYRMLDLPPGSFPRAEAIARMQVSLPMFPEITVAQLDHVAGAIEAFFTENQFHYEPVASSVPIAV